MTPRRQLLSLLASAEFARAYTLTALTAAFLSFVIARLMSPVTLATIISALSIIGLAMLLARRDELSLLRLAPTSLLGFIALGLVSVVWSENRWDTLTGWFTLFGYAIIAITIGHVRDTLQTVRAIGDTLRWLLTISLGIEILSGVLLDTPFAILGIEGNLAVGGPIQGLFGTRNMLGFIAVLALITFVIEWRTQSITHVVGVLSVSLGVFLALFSASPTVLVLAAAVGVATSALTIVRHARPARRLTVQWVLGAMVAIALAVALALRHQIIRLLDAGSDFSTRADLWNVILDFVAQQPVTGYGWFGSWERGEYPFTYINFLLSDHHRSALNAYFDILLQLGWIGLVLFLVMGGVAIVRSWLMASVRHSVVYAWTPLVLITLAVESMFESFAVTGAGWLLLVLCVLRAGQSRSWRENIDAAQTGAIPTLRPENGR
ncbi:O-antigen ligase family protein [Microbacterium esteraromaticum]|uniref:O-antigen ligase family protein n=1 Tax=Microbacterium esteraromaticum TaxID=57043 RepID=A0A939DVK3_9MICO|nr:O-antigen ligase family protein [Microbacterium esteraromaticum]MBN8205711.1 O-antigen ligase family protein [Microbacterium esteraromaticum]MBN8415865.1 O-antigen ligase family protein [Microbacterium esteraromaticum]MBN8423796.1 O-antigen ligase family protein [Microbacterium esteraromaticum]